MKKVQKILRLIDEIASLAEGLEAPYSEPNSDYFKAIEASKKEADANAKRLTQVLDALRAERQDLESQNCSGESKRTVNESLENIKKALNHVIDQKERNDAQLRTREEERLEQEIQGHESRSKSFEGTLKSLTISTQDSRACCTPTSMNDLSHWSQNHAADSTFSTEASRGERKKSGIPTTSGFDDLGQETDENFEDELHKDSDGSDSDDSANVENRPKSPDLSSDKKRSLSGNRTRSDRDIEREVVEGIDKSFSDSEQRGHVRSPAIDSSQEDERNKGHNKQTSNKLHESKDDLNTPRGMGRKGKRKTETPPTLASQRTRRVPNKPKD